MTPPGARLAPTAFFTTAVLPHGDVSVCMNITLTGASGFTGRYIIPILKDRGHSVTALCRSEASARLAAEAGAIGVVCDFYNPEQLKAALIESQADAVVHAAARLDFFGPYRDFYRDNVELTEAMLAAAQSTGVRTFIQLGAAAVVMDRKPKTMLDESAPIPENPAGAYGTTKALAEGRVLDAQSPKMRCVVLRPPWIWAAEAPAFDEVASAVRSGQFVWVAGGDYEISTAHVTTVAGAIAAALENPRAQGVYFIAEEEPIQFRRFVSERILKPRDIRPPRLSVPRWCARLSATMLEAIWKLLRLRGRPPITHIMLDLIGNQFTLDTAKARRELFVTKAEAGSR